MASWRYYYNFVAGPITVDADYISRVEHSGKPLRYFVKVSGNDLSDSGVQEITETERTGIVTSRNVTAEYSELFLGNQVLIVKRRPNDKGTSFAGALEELPTDVRFDVVMPIFTLQKIDSPTVLPLMLDATGFRREGYWAIGLSILATGLATWLVRRVLAYRAHPERNPIAKKLARYGSLLDISRAIDTDLMGETKKFGRALVTQSWVLLPDPYGLTVCRIPDLVWAFKKVVRKTAYGVTAAKLHRAILYDRFGKKLELQARNNKIDDILAFLADRAPWAVFGYSADLRKRFSTDRLGFVAMVDARRPGTLARN